MNCALHGGQLAAPYSEGMNDAVKAAVMAARSSSSFGEVTSLVWLGGERAEDSDDAWLWESTGATFFDAAQDSAEEALGYTRWAGDEPSADLNCLVLDGSSSDGAPALWSAHDCAASLHAVCEGTTVEMLPNPETAESSIATSTSITFKNEEWVGIVVGILAAILFCALCCCCVCPRPRWLDRWGQKLYWGLIIRLPGVTTAPGEDALGGYTKVVMRMPTGLKLPMPAANEKVEDIVRGMSAMPVNAKKVKNERETSITIEGSQPSSHGVAPPMASPREAPSASSV